MRIFARRDDGSEVDVTEGVQVCYDLLVGSMDWGSGFLSTEEVGQVRDLARSTGFGVRDYQYDICAGCGHRRGQHSSISPVCNYADEGRRCPCRGFAFPGEVDRG